MSALCWAASPGSLLSALGWSRVQLPQTQRQEAPEMPWERAGLCQHPSDWSPDLPLPLPEAPLTANQPVSSLYQRL